ncbi:protein Mis18-alpha [Bombina bombina]|uniref:protein Mis18-alpha n=1 Tax=Bombina bombina TaxID=8345 RepID=UPI00235A6C79|nr:protein Mis18-alpha [Bombina bombina]
MAGVINGSVTMTLDSTQGDDTETLLDKTGEDDPPMVFLCSKCKRPLGDTYGWMGSDMEDHTILLKAVSTYVAVEKVQIVSKVSSDYGCTFETVFCTGCTTTIGKVYKCTPKHLDFKRDLFCLNIDTVDSYILGSANKQAVSEFEEPITLDARAALEEELEKTKAVLSALHSRVSTIEAEVFHKGKS